MQHSNIVMNVENHVRNLFKEKSPAINIYHDLGHTLSVVNAVEKIGKETGLNGEEMEIGIISAWFHDIGYFDTIKGHEKVGIEMARQFLGDKGYPEEKIKKIEKCLLATEMPQSPKSKVEQVLCDADLHHLGQKIFFDKNELFRAEYEKRTDTTYSEVDWIKSNIDFFTQHKFFTSYARDKYDEQKQEHLMKLQKKLRKQLKRNEANKIQNQKIAIEKEKLATKKSSEKKADRGIETMFRNVMRTHVSFSSMADNKANIMISVNTLLITAIVAILMRKLDTNPHLIAPTAIITIVSLTTLIFAVLVTRPVVTAGTFTTEDIEKKRANLLFFGNFYNMKLKDFEWGMLEMMNNKDYLYGNMIKDFYYLGQVLGKKYKNLRICYNIFMYGLILSVIAFAVAVIIYEKPTDLGVIID